MLLRRHIQAIALLPFVAVVVIPAWLALRNKIPFRLGQGPTELLAQFTGALLLGLGLWMFIKSVSRFAAEGRGHSRDRCTLCLTPIVTRP